jgi:hypothetical protein
MKSFNYKSAINYAICLGAGGAFLGSIIAGNNGGIVAAIVCVIWGLYFGGKQIL